PTQAEATTREARWGDIHRVGTLVRVQHLLKLPDGTIQLAVQGVRRIKLVEAAQEDPYLVCDVEDMPEQPDDIPELEREALVRSVTGSFQQLVALAPYLPGELLGAVLNVDQPLHL